MNVLPFTEDIPLEVIAFLDPTIEKLCFEQSEGKTSIHLKFRDEDEIILNNAVDLEQYLSSGTIKGIITFSMVKEVLQSSGYLLVDEIENHFNKEIVTTLIIEVKNGIARVRSESAVYCPDCGMKLFFHGTCKRKVRAQEQTRCYVLRVLFCKSCKRTHRELPDFIVGYKRYSRDELCEIVMNEESYSCEDSTRNRTIMWLYKLCNCTAQSLIEFLEKKIKPFRTIEKLSSFVGDLLFERQSKLVLTKHRNFVTLE